MCGIVGFTGDIPERERVLHEMTDKIIHRGPDSDGYYTDPDIAMGFRRLSIIDITDRGDQPILNEDGTVKELIGAHGVGKAVNPINVEGQIEGGLVMGMGYALTENLKVENGKVTSKFGTLGLMKADKVPELRPIIIEKEGINMAYGAIGIGEITCIPTAPAIAGAYYKWDGEFRTSLPLDHTPYRKS